MIFTHGDFVRHFQSDSKIGERLLGDMMALNPVTVHKDKLSAHVLNLLERRIDDLIVIDESNFAALAARQKIVARPFGYAQHRPYQRQMVLGNSTA